jgi:aryl-alcohol dehydrogenase-like predicted oxidoreductase
MKYTELGKTGIKVSKICVGCMSFGERSKDFLQWTLNQQDTTKIVEYAISQGINFFDTANTYSHGTSEIFLGNALRSLGVPREKVVIASKVYFNEGHLSKEAIHREIEGTLQRLGTTYLDLYQIHRFDYSTPIEETMEALDSLIKEGKVRAIGASAMYGYQFHDMQICAERRGYHLFSTLQNHYNLLYREDERDLIPVAKEYGVSLIPYSPLAGGHLAHPDWDYDTERRKTDQVVKRKYDPYKENDLEIISRVKEVADRHGVPMSEVALAWLYKKGVAAPIVGATKVSHFKDAVDSLNLSLSDDELAYLEEPYHAHDVVGALKNAPGK